MCVFVRMCVSKTHDLATESDKLLPWSVQLWNFRKGWIFFLNREWSTDRKVLPKLGISNCIQLAYVTCFCKGVEIPFGWEGLLGCSPETCQKNMLCRSWTIFHGIEKKFMLLYPATETPFLLNTYPSPPWWDVPGPEWWDMASFGNRGHLGEAGCVWVTFVLFSDVQVATPASTYSLYLL